MSKPSHVGNVSLLVVLGSCKRIPNMSFWFDAHYRLVRVVATDRA